MKEKLKKLIEEREKELRADLNTLYEIDDFYTEREKRLEFLEQLYQALFGW